jgi:hypothetical protein
MGDVHSSPANPTRCSGAPEDLGTQGDPVINLQGKLSTHVEVLTVSPGWGLSGSTHHQQEAVRVADSANGNLWAALSEAAVFIDQPSVSPPRNHMAVVQSTTIYPIYDRSPMLGAGDTALIGGEFEVYPGGKI